MLRIRKRPEKYFTVAQAALLEATRRKSIGNPGEKRLSPYATGNERFVGKNGSYPETGLWEVWAD
jgi:hypothetical protein